MLLLEYADRPGVMGRVGSLLGEAAVNIEAAQISQTTDGTDAIMLLRVDRPVDPGVLEPIGASVGRPHHPADLVRRLSWPTGVGVAARRPGTMTRRGLARVRDQWSGPRTVHPDG